MSTAQALIKRIPTTKAWKLHLLDQEIAQADSFLSWKAAAIEHDRESGMDDWKSQQSSDLFDHQLIRSRLTTLRDLHEADDVLGLLYTLNEGIHGNLGGMGRPAMYEQARFGSKEIIGEYIDEVVVAMHSIANADEAVISFADKLDFFRRASHCFGRSALLLNGGAALGIFHSGVTKALFEQNLLPNVISGSSVGSLIAALLATHTNDELITILSRESLNEDVLSFTGWNGFFKGVPVLDPEHLVKVMEKYIPNMTFAEAYEKTRRHVNINISPAQQQHESRMLNAITSPNVLIRKGVMASCAVPGIFEPVTLEAKDREGEIKPYNPNRQWIDGSISNDLPAKRLSRIYGVNHFISSQNNPSVAPFQSYRLSAAKNSWFNNVGVKTRKRIVDGAMRMGQQTLSYPYIGFALTQAHAVASSDSNSDILIYPEGRLVNPMNLFKDLDESQTSKMIKAGERATWPRVEMIRNCTKISRNLDNLLAELEDQEVERLS